MERPKRPVVIVQNITREGSGRLADLLRRHKIPFHVVDLSAGQRLPDPKIVRTAIVLGGPDSANDPTEKIQQEIQWIREIISESVPYLGICLGMQLLVKALNGQVVPCQTPERGWRDDQGRPYALSLTPAGQRDPLFAEVSEPIPIFHLHGETVILPPEIVLLARGAVCIPQVVKFGDSAYGIQGHWELTWEMLEQWLREDPDLQSLNHREVLQDARSFWSRYTDIGDRIFENFLRIAGWLPRR